MSTQNEISQRASIKKAYLYDTEGGQVDMNYTEWAEQHIQDSETAHAIAVRMIDENDSSDNFDEGERIFEVYSIIDRELFKAQHDEYEGER